MVIENQKYIFPKTRKMKNASSWIQKMRSKKGKRTLEASEYERSEIINQLTDLHDLPPDIENIIQSHTRKTIDSKLKKDIILNKRLRKIQTQDEYNLYLKRESIKTFYALAPQYRKGFVMALEEDINPHRGLFKWLRNNWRGIVLYIGNRKSPDKYPGIRHFIDTMFEPNPPKSVKFREIVNYANSYLWEFEYDV
tara:strand:- start:511 stop:1095 length:585 start_codon:yes stop_codon:yes gene_type:complete